MPDRPAETRPGVLTETVITMAKFRSIAINLLVLAVTLVLFAVALELYVRIAIDDGMQYDLEMWKYAKQLKQTATSQDQGHEHRPNRSAKLMGVDVTINSSKLRDREISVGNRKGGKRILMLGDSITFGWGVRLEETVSKRLERWLNNKIGRNRYEVINAGVGNTNTEMQVAYFLNEGKELSPDVIILNFFINDAEQTPRRKFNPLLGVSYAYVYLSGKIDAAAREFLGGNRWDKYYLDLYREDQPGWVRAQIAIEKLAKYARAMRIELLLVNYPELHQLNPYRFGAVNAKVRAVALKLGIWYLDLLPSIAKQRAAELWVSPTDAHPNGRASALFAEAIGEKFVRVYSLE